MASTCRCRSWNDEVGYRQEIARDDPETVAYACRGAGFISPQTIIMSILVPLNGLSASGDFMERIDA